MVIEMRNRAPKDSEDWMSNFVNIADDYPACITVSDMTVAGVPMIFVNKGIFFYFELFEII